MNPPAAYCSGAMSVPPQPVKPDYGGAWIGGVVPALMGARQVSWLPEPAAAAARVVLLVLDGLGWAMLQRGAADAPTLAGMAGGPITAIVPTTTSAGLTSMTTGAAPAEHGLVGYRIRFEGRVLNALRWQLDLGHPPDPVRVQPVPPFGGKPVPVVTDARHEGSGFSIAHLRGGDFQGWQTHAVLVERVRRLIAGGARFVYAYYDGIDATAHAHGLSNGFLAVELAHVDDMVGALLDRLPGDCALVVTADHGQVEVGPEGVRRLDVLDLMVAGRAGESRFRSLYARRGAAADLLQAAREHLGKVAWVFTRDQLFDEGWLGPGGAAEVRQRVGDVVLAPFAPVAFADPATPREDQLQSRHGSLTADEVEVPLVAAWGRG